MPSRELDFTAQRCEKIASRCVAARAVSRLAVKG
jgi:hypothetical protein